MDTYPQSRPVTCYIVYKGVLGLNTLKKSKKLFAKKITAFN
jgi:hypothetical protein